MRSSVITRGLDQPLVSFASSTTVNYASFIELLVGIGDGK
jgi:hypothetical protein